MSENETIWMALGIIVTAINGWLAIQTFLEGGEWFGYANATILAATLLVVNRA